MGFFYLAHGAVMFNTSHGPAMDKWTPSGSGADFKLSPILSSLEPYKKYMSSFGNLENASTAGSVHSFTPSTWLSCTRPDTGRTRAHMAVTLDQVISKIISQDTPLAHCFAGVRSLRLADGPDEVHRRSLAHRELRKYRTQDPSKGRA